MSNLYAVPHEPLCDSPALNIYRRIALVSDSMREAALSQRWDELVDLGKQYRQAVQDLRACPAPDDISADERAARSRLLIDILENDAVIRDLAQPELARIGMLLTQFNRQKNLVKTYGKAFAPRVDA